MTHKLCEQCKTRKKSVETRENKKLLCSDCFKIVKDLALNSIDFDESLSVSDNGGPKDSQVPSPKGDQQTTLAPNVASTSAKKHQTPQADEQSSAYFQTLLNKVCEVNEKVGKLLSMQDEVRQLTKTVTFLSQKYEDQKNTIVTLEDKVKELTNENKKMSRKTQVLLKSNNELQKRVNEIDFAVHRNELEIVGVPETPQEDVQTVVKKIAQQCQASLTVQDVQSCKRAPFKRNNGRPIIVTFTNLGARDNFFQKYKASPITADKLVSSFKDDKIYVNEYLSFQSRKLMVEARNQKDTLDFKFLWAKEGNIFARKTETSKAVLISCIEDLDKLV